MTFKFLR